MKTSKAAIFFNIVNPKAKRFVDLSLNITTCVHKILEERNITIKEFAIKLNRDEENVSNMLTGTYNLTLKDIVDMESILDYKLI